ncbi:MAG: hypothetical protein KC549_04195 [Myxococcales bacterium]|nr:hypothetical protein [Myxococcales bacterium]
MTSTTGQYSPELRMGDANGLMYEVWLKSQTGVTTLTVSVEGSNDGINWSALSEPPSTTAGSAPDYQAIEPTTTDIIIPWARVRLKFTVDAGSALVSADCRPYRAG